MLKTLQAPVLEYDDSHPLPDILILQSPELEVYRELTILIAVTPPILCQSRRTDLIFLSEYYLDLQQWQQQSHPSSGSQPGSPHLS